MCVSVSYAFSLLCFALFCFYSGLLFVYKFAYFPKREKAWSWVSGEVDEGDHD